MQSVRIEPANSQLKYPWQQAVVDALVEYSPADLRDRIIAADNAIVGRLLQNPIEADELAALRDAFSALRIVCPFGQP